MDQGATSADTNTIFMGREVRSTGGRSVGTFLAAAGLPMRAGAASSGALTAPRTLDVACGGGGGAPRWGGAGIARGLVRPPGAPCRGRGAQPTATCSSIAIKRHGDDARGAGDAARQLPRSLEGGGVLGRPARPMRRLCGPGESSTRADASKNSAPPPGAGIRSAAARVSWGPAVPGQGGSPGARMPPGSAVSAAATSKKQYKGTGLGGGRKGTLPEMPVARPSWGDGREPAGPQAGRAPALR